ncbi:MAG: 4-hydroxythreonine-4-phosphate dehydrogenase PdxA [Holophaga sp.]|nr:4-hydroxythreonine-4-phosphate dehydrogenase PdxA [Holophaga sp.]
MLGSLQAINRWADVVVIGARAGVDLLGTSGGGLSWRWGALSSQAPRQACAGLWTRSDQPGEGYASWIDPTPEVGTGQLQLGIGSAASGRCAVEGVRAGAALVQSGQADALVTLPLAKAAAHLAGYPIPGHTEFLQELCGSPISRMAFVSPRLSVVLDTVHQSLRSVVEGLTARRVAETLCFAADRFMGLTGKSGLKVALCALNPHAGEGKAFGDEETVLDQAILAARDAFGRYDGTAASAPFARVPSPFGLGPAPEGWSIFSGPSDAAAGAAQEPLAAPRFFGPLPSDTLFQRAARGEFDLVVALYHDQGLIPIKVLEPERAVNLTLGLPYIRTSPDHGTAFDRAGLWSADARNFMEATALAVRLAGRAKGQPWHASAAPGGGPW